MDRNPDDADYTDDLRRIRQTPHPDKSVTLSTNAVPKNNRLEYWRDICREVLGSFEFVDHDLTDFEAELEYAAVGSLQVGHYRGSAMAVERKPTLLRSSELDHYIIIIESDTKTVGVDQNGNHRSGRSGITLLDNARPYKVSHAEGLDILDFFVPRAELDRAMGRTQLATGLSIDADQASYRIVSSYLRSLFDYGSSLDETRAARMSSIAVELIAAGFSERIEQSPPLSLSAAAMLCRARSYIADHLGVPGLGMSDVAGALQISVRYLHQIAAEEGVSLIDWMWERRLASAREKLSSPSYRAVPVGVIAFQCGFANQAHFSRRFKERHGCPPNEYRIWSTSARR